MSLWPSLCFSWHCALIVYELAMRYREREQSVIVIDMSGMGFTLKVPRCQVTSMEYNTLHIAHFQQTSIMENLAFPKARARLYFYTF
jgi:hypothetical protein